MDFSDLSEAAQARIAAAQLEAEKILEDGKVLTTIVSARNKLPWAKSNPEPLLPIMAQDRERLAQLHAAQHVFIAVLNEDFKAGGGLDIDGRYGKLRTIGEQLCTRYGCSPGWLDAALREWHVAALQKRAIVLEKSPARPRADDANPHRKRGPAADDAGHMRVAQLLTDDWENDLAGTLRTLAAPQDGGKPVEPSAEWKRKYKITSYADLVTNNGTVDGIDEKLIKQHIAYRKDRGQKKLSETLGNSRQTLGR